MNILPSPLLKQILMLCSECHPKFMCWNLAPTVVALRGIAFGRWWSHKGYALMNGTSTLIKELEIEGNALLLSHFSVTWRHSICTLFALSSFCHVRTPRRYHLWEQGFTRHWSCRCLDHGLLNFQNCEK